MLVELRDLAQPAADLRRGPRRREVGLADDKQVGRAQLREHLMARRRSSARAHTVSASATTIHRVAHVARHVAEDRDLAGVGDPAGLDDDLLGRVVDVAQAPRARR